MSINIYDDNAALVFDKLRAAQADFSKLVTDPLNNDRCGDILAELKELHTGISKRIADEGWDHVYEQYGMILYILITKDKQIEQMKWELKSNRIYYWYKHTNWADCKDCDGCPGQNTVDRV